MSEVVRVDKPAVPAWLTGLTLLLIFVTPGQLAHAVDPKHGPFIAYADVLAVIVGGLFVLWVLLSRPRPQSAGGLRGQGLTTHHLAIFLVLTVFIGGLLRLIVRVRVARDELTTSSFGGHLALLFGIPAVAAIVAMGITVCITAILQPSLRDRLRTIVWPPLPAWAWLIVAALSAFGAESAKAAGLEIVQLVLYFGLAYMLFVNVLATEAQRRQAVRVLLAATTLVVAFGVLQYVTATEPQVVKSIFQSRTAYSGFLAVALPLFFGLTLWSELSWERYWAGLVVIAGGLTILAPPLVWVLAIVLVVMAAVRGGAKMAGNIAVAAGAFLVLTLTLAPLNRQVFREMLNPYEEGPIFKTMQTGGEAVGEPPSGPIVKKRWIEWMPALNMLGENFMLGVGAGNYQLNIGQPEYYGFLPNVKKSEPDTNNLYLVTGGSMGLAGLVCLMAFLGHFWRLAGGLWAHAETPGRRALAGGLYGACLALLVANLFTSVLVRGTALVWALVCALVAGMGRETRGT